MNPAPHDPLPPYSRSVPQTHTRLGPVLHSYPSSQSNQLPPEYSAFDETLSTFTLRAPIIYAIASASLRPRYQLSQELSRSGKPYRLRIRRLLPTESRRLSTPTSIARKNSSVEFDEDTTLYSIENLSALSIFQGQKIEIRGRKAKTLPGCITLKEDGEKWVFWHRTRNPAGDALREENERKMQKFGYRSDDEWNNTLLFCAKMRPRNTTVEWRNANGDAIAAEMGTKFDITPSVDQTTKDVLVTCWVARRWAARQVLWEDCDKDAPASQSFESRSVV